MHFLAGKKKVLHAWLSNYFVLLPLPSWMSSEAIFLDTASTNKIFLALPPIDRPRPPDGVLFYIGNKQIIWKIVIIDQWRC